MLRQVVCGAVALVVGAGWAACIPPEMGAVPDVPGSSEPGPPVVNPDEYSVPGRLFFAATLEPDALLKIAAWPEQEPRVELTLLSTRSPNCQVEWLLDGEALALDAAPDAPQMVGPPAVLLDLGQAKQFAMQGCGRQWALSAQQLENLHQFAFRFKEKLKLQGDEPAQRKSSKRAPTGGWTSWTGLSSFPSAAEPVLSGPQLYERLSPSVLRVECKRSGGFAQGSAVVVAPSLAVTNCHVLQGALKIVVAQGKQEWPAVVKQSDPEKDRCILEIPGGAFSPIVGVRAYADLKVGETLYTLGTPSGLELTLADGILSGRREEAGVRYVQTSAPISPGSSGGGLFDARGNLVGVTTLALIGKKNLNQSLNFAIAAEMFWTP